MINTDKQLIYADLTYQLRGCFFAVYNSLGFGHKESVYQQALEEEFKEKNIPYQREKSLAVKYKDKKVGNYRPDFLIDNKIILELKAVTFMPQSFRQQLLHYLKTTDIKLGLLVNFGSNHLQIHRLIWTPDPHPCKSAPNQCKSFFKKNP